MSIWRQVIHRKFQTTRGTESQEMWVAEIVDWACGTMICCRQTRKWPRNDLKMTSIHILPNLKTFKALFTAPVQALRVKGVLTRQNSRRILGTSELSMKFQNLWYFNFKSARMTIKPSKIQDLTLKMRILQLSRTRDAAPIHCLVLLVGYQRLLQQLINIVMMVM